MLCYVVKSYGMYVMYVLNVMLYNDTLCYFMIRCVKLSYIMCVRYDGTGAHSTRSIVGCFVRYTNNID